MQVFTDCSKDGLIPHWWLSQTCEAHPCDIFMKKTSWQAHAWLEMSTHPSHLHYNKEDIFIIHPVGVPHFLWLPWLINSSQTKQYDLTLIGNIVNIVMEQEGVQVV